MITAAELQAAVREGVVTPEAADALERFVARGSRARPSGEEDLRFIRNFHDVFLAIGIVILGVGIFIALLLNSGVPTDGLEVDSFADLRGVQYSLAFSGFGAAAVYWLLAEYFARRKRLFLPAITLSLGFVAFVSFGALPLLAPVMVELGTGQALQENFEATREAMGLFWTTWALIAAAAATAFLVRFRLPFAWGIVALCLTSAAFGLFFYASPLPDTLAAVGPIFTISGVITFLVAVAFDARDPTRQTLYSDNAFWLHLAAAPQILFGILTTVFGYEASPTADPQRAAVTLAIVAALALIGLLINRRALLVSALSTIGIAIYVLVSQAKMPLGFTIATTLIVLGGSVVLLGAGWHSARRMLLAGAPKTGFIARIFPPEVTA